MFQRVDGGAVNEYIPILILGALAVAFALFSVGIAPFTGPARYNRAKMDRRHRDRVPLSLRSGVRPTQLVRILCRHALLGKHHDRVCL